MMRRRIAEESGANEIANRGDRRGNKNIANDEGRRGLDNYRDAQVSRGTSPFCVQQQLNHPLAHWS